MSSTATSPTARFAERRQRARRRVSAAIGGGCRSTGEDQRLLERLLPDRWCIDQFELDTSDGSTSAAWKIRLTHADGAAIYCRPTDSRDRLAGPDVFDSHRITRIDADNRRTVLVEPQERLFDREAVFGAVLAAAEAFSARFWLFH